VWPGVAVFPDWFHSNTQQYWNSEFSSFFNADTGVDIDALWIDMNEPSNFCEFPCTNPGGAATQDSGGASVGNVRSREVPKRQDTATGTKKGLPGRDLLFPSYKIHHQDLVLSNKTADTDIIHQGGWTEYDTHNL
jgi:alpha-glucosidase